MLKSNFYVITGGPGVGKTTLIEELHHRGYRCVPEVAREIIRQQVESGGDALPWGNTVHYSDLMLKNSVRDFIRLSGDNDTIYFFDRGIPDIYGYNQLIGQIISPDLKKAADECRYNPTVFILPSWIEIYRTDNERKQSLQEAIDTYDALKSAYTSLGYTTIGVPKMSIEERADFILNNI